MLVHEVGVSEQRLFSPARRLERPKLPRGGTIALRVGKLRDDELFELLDPAVHVLRLRPYCTVHDDIEILGRAIDIGVVVVKACLEIAPDRPAPPELVPFDVVAVACGCSAEEPDAQAELLRLAANVLELRDARQVRADRLLELRGREYPARRARVRPRRRRIEKR